MTNRASGKFTAGIMGYIRENWGSPFIVAFMVLLVGAAVCSLSNLSRLADAIAINAFYALLIGVLLQVVCFWKFRKKLSSVSAS